jgi:hypothetical protein
MICPGGTNVRFCDPGGISTITVGEEGSCNAPWGEVGLLGSGGVPIVIVRSPITLVLGLSI